MRLHCGCPLVRLLGGLLAAVLLATQGGGETLSRVRVAVVAVHDSRLFTLCPVPGREVAVGGLQIGGAEDVKVSVGPTGPALEGYQSVQLLYGNYAGIFLPLPASAPYESAAALERLAVDPAVRRAVENRFRKLGRYTVVETPSDADLVFVVESDYLPLAAGAARLPTLPLARDASPTRVTPERIFSETENEWARRQWDHDSQPTSPLPPPVPGPVARFEMLALDRLAPEWRQAALAVVVPAREYLEHAGDGSALSSAGLWQGLAVAEYGTMRPTAGGRRVRDSLVKTEASPEALVDHFHGRGPRLPKFLPVCGATAGVIADLSARSPRAGTPPSPPTSESPARIATASADALFRSITTLVTVPVLVSGQAGQPVDGLRVTGFRLFEDEVEQHVDSVTPGAEPAEIAFLVDTSVSESRALKDVKASAHSIVNELRASDRTAIVTFGSRVLVAVDFTDDHRRLESALSQLHASGGTRLYDALALAAVDVFSPHSTRKIVLLLTDGLDTESRLVDTSGALAALTAADVEVHALRYPIEPTSTWCRPSRRAATSSSSLQPHQAEPRDCRRIPSFSSTWQLEPEASSATCDLPTISVKRLPSSSGVYPVSTSCVTIRTTRGRMVGSDRFA
jgi:hypothetical protein